ncbi:MAG: phage portal protein [Elusimicrobiota bacterium]
MGTNNLSNITTSDMSNQVDDYSVAVGEDTGDHTTRYSVDWTKWLGFYEIPGLQTVIDKKAIWTVGKGVIANKKTKKTLKKIRGNGKETFNSIMYKAVITYTLAGDYFAEIIKKNGQLHNLKTLNPGRVQIITDSKGFIKEYKYLDRNGKPETTWKPNEIFHLMWNPKGDNTHGTSTVEKLTTDNNGDPGIIEMLNEAKQDLRIVFHRYVKPLLISSVDSDDEDEISEYKRKLDRAVNNGENLIIPKDTVDSIERVSIPQYSTLDPLPWIKKLEKEFIRAEGVPEVILGLGEETSEATSKMLYLAFQQLVEWNQLFLEEQIEAQLGLEVEFDFPASLLDNLQTDQRKDGKPRADKDVSLEQK